MSKPDPAGGSLESILASIRKSLSEQSADAPSETPALSPSPEDARSGRRHGLTQRLAGTTADEPAKADAQPAADDLSDLLEGPSSDLPAASAPSPAPSGAPAVSPATSGPAPEDPLWFLSRRDEPPAPQTGLPLGAAPEADGSAAAPASTSEPRLTRPEVLRASMPPFFGSSSDTATIAPASVEATAQSATGLQPPVQQNATRAASQASAPDAAIAHEVSLVAAAVETAAGRSAQPAPAGLNGRAHAASSLGGSTAAESASSAAAAADLAHSRALEAMVLDLLKPMLRQWLDENMPRLVAQALSDEAARARASEGDTKKT